MHPEAIAKRHFTMTDQERFADLSGDRNPMHLDALAARRTQAGEPVVHGIHALLWALDAAAAAGLPVAGANQIRAQFTNFMPLQREVSLCAVRQDAAGLRLALSVQGVPTLVLLLRLGARQPAADWERPDRAWEAAAPAALCIDQMAACRGWLRPPAVDQDFAEAFPAAARALTPRRLSGLAQTSRLVGMVCPGLHSIYAGLTMELTEGGALEDGLLYRVVKADERFRLVDMAVSGCSVAGKVSAFARHPPVDTPAMREIAPYVLPGEFAGTTALVAGGSRGLGAVTAKIIAAGGGQVAITYARGQMDAEAVRDDIARVHGTAACTVLAYDAMQPAAPQLVSVAGWANQLHFFATPPIFAAKAEAFMPSRFQQFCRVYVEAFHECCRAMARPDLAVFYPSSVAVKDRPPGMLEYSMAKMAGEMLCAELHAKHGLRVVTFRLPRLLTDQTASVARAEHGDSIQTMLPLVRAMRVA